MLIVTAPVVVVDVVDVVDVVVVAAVGRELTPLTAAVNLLIRAEFAQLFPAIIP